jgi:hypothetical protein
MIAMRCYAKEKNIKVIEKKKKDKEHQKKT